MAAFSGPFPWKLAPKFERIYRYFLGMFFKFASLDTMATIPFETKHSHNGLFRSFCVRSSFNLVEATPEPSPAVLSIASLKTGQQHYYVELVSLNYYTEGGEPPGLWAGSGAREFGLEPGTKVDALHLGRLCEGFDPHTAEPLVQNAGKRPGECRAPRKPGDDCTLSMPKGASIVWACANDELRRAIDKMALEAAGRVISFLEDHCGLCRVGKGGQSYENVPLLAAIFQQSTSRESDPQHHLHMLLINITRKADGKA
jgi:TrwC relaxase